MSCIKSYQTTIITFSGNHLYLVLASENQATYAGHKVVSHYVPLTHQEHAELKEKYVTLQETVSEQEQVIFHFNDIIIIYCNVIVMRYQALIDLGVSLSRYVTFVVTVLVAKSDRQQKKLTEFKKGIVLSI